MTSDSPQAQSPKSGWTLSAIKQAGLMLEGHCQGESCRRFFTFNLDELLARAGPGYLLPEILPGITCEACGGALMAKLAMVSPDNRADGMAQSSDATERIRFLEVEAEDAYANMYEATDPTTVAAHYSNAKEALHTAIGMAMTGDDDALTMRLRARWPTSKRYFAPSSPEPPAAEDEGCNPARSMARMVVAGVWSPNRCGLHGK